MRKNCKFFVLNFYLQKLQVFMCNKLSISKRMDDSQSLGETKPQRTALTVLGHIVNKNWLFILCGENFLAMQFKFS